MPNSLTGSFNLCSGTVTRPTTGGNLIDLSGGLTDNGTGVTNSRFNNTYVNSFPAMAVDKSCGPNRGNIYIVASDLAGAVINMWYYNNNSLLPNYHIWTSSSSPITISQSNLDHCWFPWVAVDDLTGVVSVVYYGSQGSVVNNTNTYVAYCDPSNVGVSSGWASIQVSSEAQTPEAYSSSIANFPLYYTMGNGIASYGGHAYPVWQDRRANTVRQIWTADIAYDAPQLASSATSQSICADPFTGTTTITGVKDYVASDQILVSSACSSSGTVIIANTAKVNTIAGQSIIIGQGFSTQPGAVFTAEIKTDITSCQTPGVQSFKTSLTNNISSDDNSEITNIDGVSVFAYPNPTNDLINVGISNNNYHNVSFTVTDMSGRFIAQYNNPTISGDDVLQIVDARSYAEGLYIITMTADDKKYSFKFAKE